MYAFSNRKYIMLPAEDRKADRRTKPGHFIMELLKLKSAIDATSIGKSEGATLHGYPTAMETINRSIFF